MKKIIGIFLIFVFFGILFFFFNEKNANKGKDVLSLRAKTSYWFILHRKSNMEYLYHGIPGDIDKSRLVKKFRVKTGVRDKKPTPLPKLLSKEYWLIVDKEESNDNPETAPYFLALNIPHSDEPPFGPVPYFECLDQFTGDAKQCNWELSGEFGLHGINGDEEKLSEENSGSSGCIRHKDEDITYLYNLLDPKKKEVKYYVKDI